MISKKKHNQLSKNNKSIQARLTSLELYQLSGEELKSVVGGLNLQRGRDHG